MGGSIDTVTLYTILLAASLWLNGIYTVGPQPLRVLFRPLRSPRLLGGSLVVDVVVVPASILALAWLLAGISEEMRVGLVIIAAASAGPIGSVLTRMVRGDQPLAVSLVTAFGALNVLTVPVLGALLLREAVPFPLGPVVTSMTLLVFAPLFAGYLWAKVSERRQFNPERKARQLQVIGKASTWLLVVAIIVAMSFDAERVVEMLFGPVGLLAVVIMTVIAVTSYVVGRDSTERATLAIVVNARGAGLSLTIVALHFAHLADARAAVLTFSLITQIVPALLVLITKRLTGKPLDSVATA